MFNKSKKILCSVLVLILFMVFAISVAAVDTVKIGAIYPMSGPYALSGKLITEAMELVVDIVNGEYPDLGFSLAPTAGLPNLGGAKIKLIIADNQGQPEFGKAEAERLITVDGVSALIGCQLSGVTKTASQVAEVNKTPFITAMSTSAELTERGFKYFFRTAAIDSTFADDLMPFLEDLNKTRGANIKNIGLIYVDNEWGVNLALDIKKRVKEHGFNIVSDVKFPGGSADLDSEVSILKRDNPDFVMFVANEADQILYIRTTKKLDYNVPVMVTTYSSIDTLLDTLGKDCYYGITRDVFSLDLGEQYPLLVKVNKMYKDRYGTNLGTDSARGFTGMMVLADAINRAGSTDKEAIRKALAETDIPADQLILPWKGIKFDAKGQNIYGTWIFRQILDGKCLAVWPLNIATAELVLPMPKWNER